MKKTFLSLAAVLLFCIAAVQPVQAADSRLYDGAGLLSGSEAAALESRLDEISNRQEVDIVVVTVYGTQEKSAMEYADDYYDEHDYRPDGILMLIDMEEREWWISTTGYGITAVTDAGLDWMADQFLSYLSSGDYAEAFTTFAETCDQFITQARSGEPFDVGNMPKDPFRWTFWLLVSAAIGLVVALIATGSMKAQLKSVGQRAVAADYCRAGALNLCNSQDLFLYHNVTRQLRPKDTETRSGGGGGSSTHTSSSGTSHGGGGGHF